MGSVSSQEVAHRGSDLIEIHQGLLYTVLEFVFTHSASPTGLEAFLAAGAGPGPAGYSNRHDKACHLLGLFALVSYILPADDFAAAFVDPQPSDWIAEYLAAATTAEALVRVDSRFGLRDRDRQLLRRMQQESKRLYKNLSDRNALSGRGALSSRTERRGRESGRLRDVAVAGAYHVMDGDAKLEALQRALGLLASLVQQANLKATFRRRTIPPSVDRFVGMLPEEQSRRTEVFTLSRLVGVFEAERARLLGIKLARAARARSGEYLWPRWGNPRPRPTRGSRAPLIPPVLRPKGTVAYEPPTPNKHLLDAIRGKALWKSGDLNTIHVIQETARARALRRGRLSATWSPRASGAGQSVAQVGIVSAHTAGAGRGSGGARANETVVAIARAARAASSGTGEDGDSDGTVLGSLAVPATRRAVRSEDCVDLSEHGVSEEESCFADAEGAQYASDEVRGHCADHDWEDFELYPSDNTVSTRAPRLETFPLGQPLTEDVNFMTLLYLPTVHDMEPGDDQAAILQWIRDAVEDGDSADL
ncbi:hypothetical protein MMC15_006466 [Xylographa vitiligo]|nr:hypothetical protein [Xylographa vitiligo]